MKTDRLAGTCYDYTSNLYLAALSTEFPDYRRTLRCTREAILHRHFREAFLPKVLGHSRLFFVRR